MRCGISPLVLSGMILGCASTVVTGQVPTFRSGTDTVSVFPTVKDRNGRLVPNLTQDEFEVLDNGKPAVITVFSNRPQPITAAVLVDLSSAARGLFFQTRDGLLSFIDALAPGDRARVCSISWPCRRKGDPLPSFGGGTRLLPARSCPNPRACFRAIARRQGKGWRAQVGDARRQPL